jgi:FAD/FMN-containing dehydrogenase
VDLAADNQTARIGGGANTRQIFAALNPLGLSYVGRRVGSVGIGGYTLGGGTSVVSAQYGWALDNTFEYEVGFSMSAWLPNI